MNDEKRRNVVLCGIFVSAFALAVMAGTPGHGGEKKARTVTLTGRVVDLHSHMTGKFALSDPVRSTRACIQAGVPVALEVSDGLVVVGQGTQGPHKILARLAYEQVELKGRLYEHGGLRYIDVSDVKAAKATEEPADDESEDAVDVEPDSEDSDEPLPSAQGACCLPEGGCIDTDDGECADSDGDFYAGAVCDEIECD